MHTSIPALPDSSQTLRLLFSGFTSSRLGETWAFMALSPLTGWVVQHTAHNTQAFEHTTRSRHYLEPSISHRRQVFVPEGLAKIRRGAYGWEPSGGEGGSIQLRVQQAGLMATPPEQRGAVMWPPRPRRNPQPACPQLLEASEELKNVAWFTFSRDWRKDEMHHLTVRQQPNHQKQTNKAFPSACRLSSRQRYPAVQSRLHCLPAPNAAQITHGSSYRPSAVHY